MSSSGVMERGNRLSARLGFPRRSEARAPLTAEEKSERFVLRLMTIAFAVGVMTMKVAVPLGGGPMPLQVQLVLLIQYGVIGILALRGRAKLSVPKFLMFGLFSLVCLATAMFQSDPNFSMPSLSYVLLIYAGYLFVVPVRDETLEKFYKTISIFGVVAVGLVAMDWLVQFAGMKMPNIENIIPRKMLFYFYVYLQPVEWGSRFQKPNGFFFLETSYVSQFIAFALVMEVALFQRLKYMVVLGVGLVISFGGTGMTLALLSAPVLLFYFRMKLLPLVLIALPVMGVTAVKVGLVENIQKRTAEFDEQGASANQRFNAQFERVAEALSGPTREALFGIGSGQMPRRLNIMWTPISKVIVEYGLFAYILFYIFLIYAMFGRGIPFIISWMMLIQYLFLNGSFLVPVVNFYNVMFAALLVVRPADQTRLRRVFSRHAPS